MNKESLANMGVSEELADRVIKHLQQEHERTGCRTSRSSETVTTLDEMINSCTPSRPSGNDLSAATPSTSQDTAGLRGAGQVLSISPAAPVVKQVLPKNPTPLLEPDAQPPTFKDMAGSAREVLARLELLKKMTPAHPKAPAAQDGSATESNPAMRRSQSEMPFERMRKSHRMQ